MTRVTLPTLAVLLAAIAGGCGQSDDRQAVRSLTEAFAGAHAAGDGARACSMLTIDARKAVEDQEHEPCAQAITDSQFGAGDVADVEVYVTNAKVRLTTGDSFFLSEQSEGWRLSALGCRPEGGVPADRPLECEVEA